MDRTFLFRVGLAIYVILLILSQFLLSSEGGLTGIFTLMSAIGLLCFFAAKDRPSKALAVISILTALCFMVVDYEQGKRLSTRMENVKRSVTNP